MNKGQITLAGEIFSGKSTVGRILAGRLGYEFLSMGDIFRQEARDRNLTVVELSKLYEGTDADLKLDENLIALKNTKGLVVDGRMGWHFLVNSLKVYLKASTSVKLERALASNRGNEEQLEEADELVPHFEARRKSENVRYTLSYGVDVSDESNFDLIIDTSDKTPIAVAEEIIAYVKANTENLESGLLQYINEEDKIKFTKGELDKAYKQVKHYYANYPGVEVGNVVFFNESQRGRVLSFSLICDEDDFEDEEKLEMDANGIYIGLQYVYGYNLDFAGCSEMGSVFVIKDENGKLRRRPFEQRQCISF